MTPATQYVDSLAWSPNGREIAYSAADKSGFMAAYSTKIYGIDANVFGIHGPDDRQNLGSVVQGTVTVPVWNWGATKSKVRQAELQKKQAEFDLSFTRRQLQTNIQAFYLEGQAARAQLDSLRSSESLSEESLRLTLREGMRPHLVFEPPPRNMPVIVLQDVSWQMRPWP